MSNEEPTTFPSQTIARTFTTASFKHPDTKINASALNASVEYLRLFTREAIWRAEQNRQQIEQDLQASRKPNASSNSTVVDLLSSSVIEESDLETIGGTLVLDF